MPAVTSNIQNGRQQDACQRNKSLQESHTLARMLTKCTAVRSKAIDSKVYKRWMIKDGTSRVSGRNSSPARPAVREGDREIETPGLVGAAS